MAPQAKRRLGPALAVFAWVGIRVLRAVGRVVFRVSRHHVDRLPRGACVVAANHFSHVDPPLITAGIGRNVRWLAVDEIYGNSRIFDAFNRSVGAIPLSRRRPPFGAMKLALASLADGVSIGMFPEGRRVATWGEEQPRRGAAWLALHSGTPLVPVAVVGTDGFLGVAPGRIRGTRFGLVVGEPIEPDDFVGHTDPVGAITAEWKRRMDEMIDEFR